MEPSAIALLSIGAFLGAAVQAAVGFGFALIAAPLFLAALASTSAMQVLVAIHLVQSAMLVPRVWRQAPWPLLRTLMVGALAGLPVGLAVFRAIDLPTLKLALGLVMVAFSALVIGREAGWIGRSGSAHLVENTVGWRAIVTGAGSGALTAILVMPGPPLIMYLAGRPLAKDVSRAVSLTFFGGCYLVATALQAAVVGMPVSAWIIVAGLAPVVAVGTLIGQGLAHRLSERGFRLALLAIMLASGVLVLASV